MGFKDKPEKEPAEKEKIFGQCLAVVLLAFSIFAILSLVSYHPEDLRFNISAPNAKVKNFAGPAGAHLAWGLLFIIGWGAYLLPLMIILWAVSEFFQQRPRNFWVKTLGIIILFFALASLLSIFAASRPTLRLSAGGVGGLYFSQMLLGAFSQMGSVVILLLIAVLALYLCTDFFVVSFIFYHIADTIKRLKELFQRRAQTKAANLNPASLRLKPAAAAVAEKEKPLIKIPELKLPLIAQPQKSKAAAKPPEEKLNITPSGVAAPKKVKIDKEEQTGDYKLPGLDLLDAPPPAQEQRQLAEDYEQNSKILEETLRDFGIEVKVVEVEQGPVITRYELQPAPGVKVNRIVSLSDDIALAMKAHSVRIIAPIPGKARVGVEVPNSSIAMVYLRELLASPDFQNSTSKLTLALGKDTSGAALITELNDMPHLLIAGTTGSGKTVCVNTLIMSILFNAAPEEVKFLMIDPKMVELSIYNGLPHLICPVVTDAKKAAGALAWVVSQMEERYKIFAKIGARNIDLYNEKVRTVEGGEFELLPYIVVVIDELADLMIIAAKDVEEAIMRLAQLARAVGIHIILATQRPSVDVITGVIKANFPARISFKVASKVDSRTVLDMNGADKLLGKGDMLFIPPGSAKPIRAQGSLIGDKEIERVVNFIREQRKETSYVEDVLKQQEDKIFNYKNQPRDELFEQAAKLVIETGQASVSMLQRRLRLGYTRAARLIDLMEEEGIIGGYRGSKAREILVDRWEDFAKTEAGEDSAAPAAGQGEAN